MQTSVKETAFQESHRYQIISLHDAVGLYQTSESVSGRIDGSIGHRLPSCSVTQKAEDECSYHCCQGLWWFPPVILGNVNSCLFIVCAPMFRSFMHHMDKLISLNSADKMSFTSVRFLHAVKTFSLPFLQGICWQGRRGDTGHQHTTKQISQNGVFLSGFLQSAELENSAFYSLSGCCLSKAIIILNLDRKTHTRF